MKIEPDCIPCILKMAISGIRGFHLSGDKSQNLFNEILEIPALRGKNRNTTSPEVIEDVMKKIIHATGTRDPFLNIKKEQNARAMEIYPFLKELVQSSETPLNMAVKMAALGNFIDLMITDNQRDIKSLIREKIKIPFPEKTFKNLLERLQDCSLLLYVGDNSGEIVFDRVLIETIKEEYNMDVVFIVRKDPALNDATKKEAEAVGLDKIAEIIENGIYGPLPGTIIDRCSQEVKELIGKSDFIISKGGGNFDTLDEEDTIKSKTAFILLSKCYPYFDLFNVPLYNPIFKIPEKVFT